MIDFDILTRCREPKSLFLEITKRKREREHLGEAPRVNLVYKTRVNSPELYFFPTRANKKRNYTINVRFRIGAAFLVGLIARTTFSPL